MILTEGTEEPGERTSPRATLSATNPGREPGPPRREAGD
jgi:hypothetical protein